MIVITDTFARLFRGGSRRFRSAALLATLAGALIAALAPASLAAQAATDSLRLSLVDALRRGLNEGEEVLLAAATQADAEQQVKAVRAGVFPQLRAQMSYTRIIRTPFGGATISIPDSLRFTPDPSASVEERLDYLERNTPNAALTSLGSLFSGLPIGQANTYIASVGITQTVFDPAVFAGIAIAKEFERIAGSQSTEQRLDVSLAIVEAYYGAVLADRLARIVTASAAQLEAQADQVSLVRAAGNASDLDLLRVQVDLENIAPQRVDALNQRDLALRNLKRLINVPMAQPVALDDPLQADGFRPIPIEAVARLAEQALARRATVDAQDREVEIRRQQLRIARGAFLPTVSVSANFGKQALPSQLVPSRGDFLDDWNAGIAVQLPLFTGGQRRADVSLARVQLRTAELQLAQLRETVELEVAQQRAQLERAAVLIEARAQTVSQAERVFSLTNLSYERGLQTNLQVTEARLQLQQSRANEAQALHDYYIALARLLRAAGASESEIESRVAAGQGTR